MTARPGCGRRGDCEPDALPVDGHLPRCAVRGGGRPLGFGRGPVRRLPATRGARLRARPGALAQAGHPGRGGRAVGVPAGRHLPWRALPGARRPGRPAAHRLSGQGQQAGQGTRLLAGGPGRVRAADAARGGDRPDRGEGGEGPAAAQPAGGTAAAVLPLQRAPVAAGPGSGHGGPRQRRPGRLPRRACSRPGRGLEWQSGGRRLPRERVRFPRRPPGTTATASPPAGYNGNASPPPGYNGTAAPAGTGG